MLMLTPSAFTSLPPPFYADAPGLIEATSQVSRFHAETLECAAARGLDLPGVQLGVDRLQLLEDAHLQLRPGARYGLIGR